MKEAGASRVHCNLESSERYFPSVCTTHTYADKIETLRAAKRAGLSICSGGIMGLGETVEDRIDMTNDEVRRIVAVFRFIIPDASIRLAGGRGLLGDKGEGCFAGGANAAISGDMLTTAGITVETDMALLEKMGYTVMKE